MNKGQKIVTVIFILGSFLVSSWSLEGKEKALNSAAPFWFILNLSSLFSEHTRSCSDDLETDHQTTFNNQEDSHTHKKPPVLEVGMPSEPQPNLPPPAPPPGLEIGGNPQRREPAPPLSQQTVGKVHSKNKVTSHLRNEFRSCDIIFLWCESCLFSLSKSRKLLQLFKAVKEETSQKDFSKTMSRKPRKLKSQCGIDAWKRWIQWRESQTNLDLVSCKLLCLSSFYLHFDFEQSCVFFPRSRTKLDKSRFKQMFMCECLLLLSDCNPPFGI